MHSTAAAAAGVMTLVACGLRRRSARRDCHDITRTPDISPLDVLELPSFNPGQASAVLFGDPAVIRAAGSNEDAYLGAELAANGDVYCIPGSARYVLKLDPRTGQCSAVGPQLKHPMVTCSLKRNIFKWLRGIRAPNGNIYGIPSNADRVLKIVPSTGEVTTIGPTYKGIWKWHGGVMDPDTGCIYGIPCNAERVLKIDTSTDDVCVVGPALPGRQKWYGGLRAPSDGCIYGIANCADAVIRIDPRCDGVTTIGDGSVAKGGWKWHGGVVGLDGCIYGMPSHAECVLKIVPHTSEVKMIGGPFPTATCSFRGRKFKYGGAVVAPNGNIYGLASDADFVLKIEPATEKCSLVGPRFPGKNKWQNGFVGRDGHVYGIPCDAPHVLRIDPLTDAVGTCGAPLPDGREKWEGGVVGNDGAMYCAPQQAPCVLKIDPAYNY